MALSHSAAISVRAKREREEARRRGEGDQVAPLLGAKRAALAEHLGMVALVGEAVAVQNADGTFPSLTGYDD
jgi:hypothetical protein